MSFAQLISLEIPARKKIKQGEEVNVVLKIQNPQKYHVQMSGQPEGASLHGYVFHWVAKNPDKNAYLIRFKLIDSALKVVDETDLEIVIEPSHEKPSLTFDRNLPDTIRLIENEKFSFSAHLKTAQNNDPASVKIFFTFDENPNIRNFDSCSISVIGDLITFHWVPSNKEALQEYLKLRITLIDADQSITNQVLNFRVKNINQKPYFKNDIPDTIYIRSTPFILDFLAIDPDNDKLKYNYSPKSSAYNLQGSTLVFRENKSSDFISPLHLTITASDNKNIITKEITIVRLDAAVTNASYLQPVIGDFTKKVFSEGDSILTYLNISNYNDLENLDITYTDLTLPSGINGLTKNLIFEKEGSYIKIYSKGILPYSLVDRDYNYNISVAVTSKDPMIKPSFRVLVLTVENRVDPKNIVQQKDSLTHMVNSFLFTENIYKTNLDKVRIRINRPWWKKVALVTGTLSGVLTLIQSQKSDKTISAISACVSLASITIANLPSLSEKALSLVDEKIAASKARSRLVLDKQAAFIAEWSFYMDQSEMDKIKSDTEELIAKNISTRKDDICWLLKNKKVKRKIDRLIKKSSEKGNVSRSIESIFQCVSK